MGSNNGKCIKKSNSNPTINNIIVGPEFSDLENQLYDIQEQNKVNINDYNEDNVSSLHTYNSKNASEEVTVSPEKPVNNELTSIDNIADQLNNIEALYCEIEREENVLKVIEESLKKLERSTESPEKISSAKQIFNEKFGLIDSSLKKKNEKLSELLVIKNSNNKYGILHRSEIDTIIRQRTTVSNDLQPKQDSESPPPVTESLNDTKQAENCSETENSVAYSAIHNSNSFDGNARIRGFSFGNNTFNDKKNENVEHNNNNNVYYGKIKKTTYSEVYNILEELFHKQSNNSLILDIIIIYIKCQKMLYIEAKTFCEGKLYKLMLPAIFISALTSILSLAMSSVSWGPILISCISGINSFILALISYLKLDGKAEAHKISAHKFDKLQSYCEFKSGQLLLTDNINLKEVTKDNNDTKKKDCKCDKVETIDDIIKGIGEKVKEIKETNNFILPEIIRYKFKDIYASNIFGDVKELQNTEYTLINELKNKINKVRLCENKLIQLYQQNSDNTHKTIEEEEYEQLLDQLELEKQSQIKAIILYKNNYIKLYNEYKKEINDYIKTSMDKRIHWCTMLKT